jgi:hypothetical protein
MEGIFLCFAFGCLSHFSGRSIFVLCVHPSLNQNHLDRLLFLKEWPYVKVTKGIMRRFLGKIIIHEPK